MHSYSQEYGRWWIGKPLLKGLWSIVYGSLFNPPGGTGDGNMDLPRTVEEERALFREISSGDEHAFKAFYQLTSAKVYGYCIKMTRSAVIATELLQETYIAIWKQRSYLDQVTFPRAYAMRIASRAVYKYFSQKNKAPESLEDHHSEKLIHPQVPTHAAIETKEILSIIEQVVKLLPPQQQQVFRLNKYDGLSYKEIAQTLNLSVSTVSNYLEIAMKKVRAGVLGKQG